MCHIKQNHNEFLDGFTLERWGRLKNEPLDLHVWVLLKRGRANGARSQRPELSIVDREDNEELC